MWVQRRQLVARLMGVAAAAATLPADTQQATAQTYPARPVRIVVPVAPGGATDVTARLIGQWLSDRLGQRFLVENRPGAAALLAPPDGYTLLVADNSAAINANLSGSPSSGIARDASPVAGIARIPQVMQVTTSLPVRNVAEFIAYAKANPGKISLGSDGMNSPARVVGEYFKQATGTDLTDVPYRGAAAAVSDLIDGQIHVAFTEPATSLDQVRAGKLRALAVTSAARSEMLPDVPTLAEFVPGFEASLWVGLVAPKDTPRAIVETLNAEINRGIADPKMRSRFAEFGATALPGSPAEFGNLIRDETARWGRVLRGARIKFE